MRPLMSILFPHVTERHGIAGGDRRCAFAPMCRDQTTRRHCARKVLQRQSRHSMKRFPGILGGRAPGPLWQSRPGCGALHVLWSDRRNPHRRCRPAAFDRLRYRPRNLSIGACWGRPISRCSTWFVLITEPGSSPGADSPDRGTPVAAEVFDEDVPLPMTSKSPILDLSCVKPQHPRQLGCCCCCAAFEAGAKSPHSAQNGRFAYLLGQATLVTRIARPVCPPTRPGLTSTSGRFRPSLG